MTSLEQMPFCQKLTIAVAALRDATVNRKTSISKADQILLGCGWPGFLHHSALWFWGEEISNGVLLSKCSVKAHEGVSVSNLLLLGQALASPSIATA